MSPAQQAALEACARRALTDAEVEQINPLLDPDNRNDVAIAAILSVGRTRVQSFKIGIATILGALAPNGGVFLSALQTLATTDPNVYWSLELIKQGNLDVGHPATVSLASALGDQHPAVKQAIAALLALGIVPDLVQVNTVSDALNKAEGRMTL